MFRGDIFERSAEKLAYLLEGHKSLPNNDNIILIFKKNVLQMYSEDQSRSISVTSEFSYENFDGFEMRETEIKAEVDVVRLYKIVKTLSKCERF